MPAGNTPAELLRVIEAAEDQGWQVRLTKNGHYRFKPPSKRKRLVFTGSTPSDHRAIKNIKSQLRRQGLNI